MSLKHLLWSTMLSVSVCMLLFFSRPRGQLFRPFDLYQNDPTMTSALPLHLVLPFVLKETGELINVHRVVNVNEVQH